MRDQTAGAQVRDRFGFLLKHARERLSAISGPALVPTGINGRELAVLTVLVEGEPPSQLEAAQQQAKQELKSDISQVKEASDTKISAVGSEVSNVKTDVAATKTELEKTVADLKRATGDLDGHSVLIATNAKELAALRTLGERNYFDFTVTKSKASSKVSDVQIQLKKADIKKHTYTIELTVDDATVEKKDKVMNEPVQFMTSKSKQPYELVVNKVTKDTIAGYIAVPKVLNQRN